MNPLEKLNLIFKGQVELEKKVDAFANEVAQLKTARTTTSAPVSDIMREIEERSNKRNNLIISGLPAGNWVKFSRFLHELHNTTNRICVNMKNS